MNLILSDVEETITIVDVDVEGGGESVRVRCTPPICLRSLLRREQLTER